MTNRDTDPLIEHSTLDNEMCAANLDQVKEGLVFNLPNEQEVASIVVWNYNKPAYTDWGIQKMDISAWTKKEGWTTVLKDVELEEAEGSNGYDEPTVVEFKPVLAKMIRFENLRAFDPKSEQIGLSEVHFHQLLGPEACNPVPEDGSEMSFSKSMRLAWTAGKNAVAHDIYIGESQGTLQCLGRIKGSPEVMLSGLSQGGHYIWRVDEVNKQGIVEKGPLWSFSIKDDILVGYWPFDGTIEERIGLPEGRIVNEVSWEDGHNGKALKLDGEDNYISLPRNSVLETGNSSNGHLSVSVWIKNDPEASGWGTVIGTGDGGWLLARDSNNGMMMAALWVNRGGLVIASNDTNISDGKWHHVVLVYDGSALNLYVDKVQKTTTTAGGLIQNMYNKSVLIGENAGAAGRCWKGLIDDVRIYDQALDSSHIEQVGQGKKVDLASEGELGLVDADLVEEGQSLEEIAAEQEVAAQPEKSKNLISVLVIVVIIAVVAAISMLRKKK